MNFFLRQRSPFSEKYAIMPHEKIMSDIGRLFYGKG